jgi:hypothetical protein
LRQFAIDGRSAEWPIRMKMSIRLVMLTSCTFLFGCSTPSAGEARSGSHGNRLGGNVGVTVGTGPTHLQRMQAMDAQRQRRDQWARANP